MGCHGSKTTPTVPEATPAAAPESSTSSHSECANVLNTNDATMNSLGDKHLSTNSLNGNDGRVNISDEETPGPVNLEDDNTARNIALTPISVLNDKAKAVCQSPIGDVHVPGHTCVMQSRESPASCSVHDSMENRPIETACGDSVQKESESSSVVDGDHPPKRRQSLQSLQKSRSKTYMASKKSTTVSSQTLIRNSSSVSLVSADKLKQRPAHRKVTKDSARIGSEEGNNNNVASSTSEETEEASQSVKQCVKDIHTYSNPSCRGDSCDCSTKNEMDFRQIVHKLCIESESVSQDENEGEKGEDGAAAVVVATAVDDEGNTVTVVAAAAVEDGEEAKEDGEGEAAGENPAADPPAE